MPAGGLWMRVFIGLFFAVLPPILLLVAAAILAESLLRDVDPNLVAIIVVVGSIVWAAILAIVYTRALSQDIRSLLSLAERGEPGPEPELGSAAAQLGAALEERNRQVATLASAASAVPIDDAPSRVIAAVVSAARSVMGDPTWRCAVLASEDPALLPPGVYLGDEDATEPAPLGELERWASVTGAGEPVRHVEGPWGAFVVVDVSVSDRLRGVLYAPWEGRAAPSPALVALLTLVGQHAGTAIEHSLLYSRVRSQADELNRLAGVQADFLRGVTHDLQTPLTSIGALATELRANAGVPEGARADLDSIAHQADRLRRMVAQLLVASRVEAGVLTPRQEVFAVGPLVDRVWSALRADRPFELTVDDRPHLAIGDPDRLEQVLWAVLDNAVKYSPDGSPIHVTVAPAGGTLRVTVQDHGSGMDPETRERAFEQFYRSDRARRMAPDGSGVGLYAARGIMAAMGGSIQVDSQLGEGTRIVLALPAEAAGSDE